MSSGITTAARPWPARVTLLAPAGDAGGLPGFLSGPASAAAPFDPARRQSLDGFSRAILRDPVLRADAGAVALAYWLRRGNIEALVSRFLARAALEPEVVFVPAGRVFHVAPANVDTLFVYSWALSCLCGNANVVRLSSAQSPIAARLLEILNLLMASDADLAAANRFLTYAHDDEVTGVFSAWCSHRVIWGGDESVRAVRSVPLNPHAGERAFASKFSYSVFSARAVLEASAEAMAALAAAFFNDVFWFDQMACSSPQIVFWMGAEDDAPPAIARFESALSAEAGRRRFTPPTHSAVRRRDYAFLVAARDGVKIDLRHPAFVGVRAASPAALRRDVCGGGLIQHVTVAQPEQVAGFSAECDQTITHFGLSACDLRALATVAGPKGVDRIVPAGEALAFGTDWDGFDLLLDLLRKVVVRSGSRAAAPAGPEARI